MNNFLTEEEELEIVLAISSEDARDLVADEAFARALAQTLDEVHEQREREQIEREQREQRARNLAEDEAFARSLEEVHEQKPYNAPRTNGLSPQEAAAFAAYARRDTYNNYGKKK